MSTKTVLLALLHEKNGSLRAGYRLTLGSLKKRNMESCQISAGAGV